MKTYTVRINCMTHGDKTLSHGMTEERLEYFIQDCRDRGDEVMEGKCYVVREPGMGGCTVVFVALPEGNFPQALPLSA